MFFCRCQIEVNTDRLKANDQSKILKYDFPKTEWAVACYSIEQTDIEDIEHAHSVDSYLTRRTEKIVDVLSNVPAPILNLILKINSSTSIEPANEEK